MLDNLTQRLAKVVKTMRGEARLTEANTAEMLREPEPPPPEAAVRHVWVAAVPATWNIVPNGRDGITGNTFAPAETVFPTVVYRRYSRGWKGSFPLSRQRMPLRGSTRTIASRSSGPSRRCCSSRRSR